MKFLIFATDVLPIAGLPTSGTALRTFGIAQGLRAKGHEVVVSVPKPALRGLLRRQDPKKLAPKSQAELAALEEFAFDGVTQERILKKVKPDVIICGHWPAMSLLFKPAQPLFIDLAGPHLLERHYMKAPAQPDAVLVKLGAIATADYFIVSGPSQLRYFQSFFDRAEVKDWPKRVITLTMPLNPELPPARTETPADPRFIFGGVFLPWQDPAPALRRVVARLNQEKRGKLHFVGGKHPNYEVTSQSHVELLSEISRSPYVEASPMLPYDEFLSSMQKADVALDLMEWNLERELAITIRSTTYLWSGLPVIYNDFADLGRLISEYDAGWLCRSGDSDALENILTEIFEKPEIVLAKSHGARRLAAERFAWNSAVQPILDKLSGPRLPRSREVDIFLELAELAELEISSAQAVAQRFTCRKSHLARVECQVATHGRQHLQPLTMKLFDVSGGGESGHALPGGKLLAERMLSPSEVRDNGWIGLEFAPQPEAAGRSYLLEVSAAGAANETNVTPWTIKNSSYPLQGFWHGGAYKPELSLCIRTTCSASE